MGVANAVYWKSDRTVASCEECLEPFTLFRRRHHCRDCGGLFCGSCSKFKGVVPHRNILTPVRICSFCRQFQTGTVEEIPGGGEETTGCLTPLSAALSCTPLGQRSVRKEDSAFFSRHVQSTHEFRTAQCLQTLRGAVMSHGMSRRAFGAPGELTTGRLRDTTPTGQLTRGGSNVGTRLPVAVAAERQRYQRMKLCRADEELRFSSGLGAIFAKREAQSGSGLRQQAAPLFVRASYPKQLEDFNIAIASKEHSTAGHHETYIILSKLQYW